jgi:hypothetical protein
VLSLPSNCDEREEASALNLGDGIRVIDERGRMGSEFETLGDAKGVRER